MNRPGVGFTILNSTPNKSIPDDTGTGFFIGPCEKGPSTPQLITSLERFEAIFGGRLSDSSLYDSVEVFFREGASRCYVARVLGPNPSSSTAEIFDQSGSTSPGDVALVATAVNAGAWGEDLNVEIVAGSSGGLFVVVVSDDNLGELERSGDLADRAEAVTWSEGSDYIRLTLGGSSEDPRVQGPTSFSTGDDDRGNITDTELEAAADTFDIDLGPGQIAAPGFTATTAHVVLLAHAAERNRRAILDLPNTDDDSTLSDAVAAITENLRYGAAWGNWPIINGITASTTRTIPPSGVIMGLIARSDRLGTPNQPAAGSGRDGQSLLPRTVIDLAESFSTDIGEALNSVGVNLFRSISGVIQNYGYRSLSLQDADPGWWQFSNSRLIMAIVARGITISRDFVFAEIGADRRTLARYEGRVRGEALLPYYKAGSLYGNTADEAFSVDATSIAANPDSEIALGNIRCLVAVRPSAFAEAVSFVISNVPISQSLAA